MFELFEIWRNNRADPALFVERIRAFTLPSADISSPVERVKHAIYWKERYEEIDTLVKTHGLSVLGETDLKQFKLMQDLPIACPTFWRRSPTSCSHATLITSKTLARRSRR